MSCDRVTSEICDIAGKDAEEFLERLECDDYPVASPVIANETCKDSNHCSTQ